MADVALRRGVIPELAGYPELLREAAWSDGLICFRAPDEINPVYGEALH
jgi:hypothetical protein